MKVPVAESYTHKLWGVTSRPEYTPDADGYKAYATRVRHLAERSLQKWVPIISRFERLLVETELSIVQVTYAELDLILIPAMIDDYEDRHGKEPSVPTVCGWWDALNAYFEYLSRAHPSLVRQNYMKLVPKPRWRVREITHLTPEEDQALAFVEKVPLESVVVGLMREAGLRVSEVSQLMDKDVDVQQGELQVQESKTDAGVGTVFLSPSLIWKIQLWRDHKRELGIDSPYLVATKKTGRVSSQYLWVIVKAVAARAGVRLHLDEHGNPVARDKAGKNLSEVSPHTLRKTYGMDLLNSGVPLAIVSDVLRHAHQGVTEQAYARPLREKAMHEALRAASGGPYGTVKVLDAADTSIRAMDGAEAGTDGLLARIDSMIEALQSMRSQVEALGV